MRRSTDEHASETLSALVARFELRRRAATSEFGAGVRLADADAVTIDRLTAHAVRGRIRDGRGSHTVELTSAGDTIAGHCGCGTPLHRVCRHQVALAHAVWERDQVPDA